MSDINNPEVRAAIERRRTDETKILQKVNSVFLDAFHQKFPRAIEHSLRLLNERLQHCLSKPAGTDLAQPSTWPATTQELADLTQAMWHLEQIRLNWPSQE